MRNRTSRSPRTRRAAWSVPGQTPALVAVINRRRDWRLVLDRHWYRIPVRTAPERLERARYIAWYQTAAFGEEKWAVNWYALVERVIAMRRVGKPGRFPISVLRKLGGVPAFSALSQPPRTRR